MITVKQIKAARGLLEWSQDDLADAAIISRPALNNLERRQTKPHVSTLEKIQRALEKAGIEFIDGGVRYSKQQLNVEVLEGSSALLRLNQDIVDTLLPEGGYNYISGVREPKFVEEGGQKWVDFIKKYPEIGITEQILLKDGDTDLLIPKEHYRWVSEDVFMNVPHFVYGDRYAIILWGPPQKIIIIKNQEIADSYKKQFLYHWERGKIPDIPDDQATNIYV